MHLDVAKFVGAASAPVALIIATSIFLSNLTTKWWSMTGAFRSLTGEYRGAEIDGHRKDSVKRQLKLYDRRLRLLMRATLLLTLAIISFIFTVLFTGITTLFPNSAVLQVLTVGLSFAGLAFLASSVLAELIENSLGKQVLELEQIDEADFSPVDAEYQDSHV
jgi:polyferredoxin